MGNVLSWTRNRHEFSSTSHIFFVASFCKYFLINGLCLKDFFWRHSLLGYQRVLPDRTLCTPDRESPQKTRGATEPLRSGGIQAGICMEGRPLLPNWKTVMEGWRSETPGRAVMMRSGGNTD